MDLQLEDSVRIIGKMPDGLISCRPRAREETIVRQGRGLRANQKQPSLVGKGTPGLVHLIALDDLYPIINNLMENT